MSKLFLTDAELRTLDVDTLRFVTTSELYSDSCIITAAGVLHELTQDRVIPAPEFAEGPELVRTGFQVETRPYVHTGFECGAL